MWSLRPQGIRTKQRWKAVKLALPFGRYFLAKSPDDTFIIAWVQLLSLMGMRVFICGPEEDFYVIITLLSCVKLIG